MLILLLGFVAVYIYLEATNYQIGMKHYSVLCQKKIENDCYLAIMTSNEHDVNYLAVLDQNMKPIKKIYGYRVINYQYKVNGKNKNGVIWNGYFIMEHNFKYYNLYDTNFNKINIPYKCTNIEFLANTDRCIKVVIEDESGNNYEGIIDIDLNTCIKPIYTSIKVLARKFFAAYNKQKDKTDIYMLNKENKVHFIGSIDYEVVGYNVYKQCIYYKTYKVVKDGHLIKTYYGLYDKNLKAVVETVCDSITDINQNGEVRYFKDDKSDTLNVEKERLVQKNSKKKNEKREFDVLDILADF